MNRKLFDVLASLIGVAMVVVLVVAGGLLMWGYSFANSSVHSQLAQQQITFPTKAEFAQAKVGTEIEPVMIPYIGKYAGQPLTTGQQAEAYADHFIFYHLQEIGGGQTYAQLSADALALPPGTPAYTAAEAKVQTVFQGTTLRGMLLNAYGWWKMGQIALISAIAAFIAAAIASVLSVLGLRHFRKVPLTEEIPRLVPADQVITTKSPVGAAVPS